MACTLLSVKDLHYQLTPYQLRIKIKFNKRFKSNAYIDKSKIEVQDKYMKRMNKGLLHESGIFVMDLLSNLERISDHQKYF